jgi:hypothetical protein
MRLKNPGSEVSGVTLASGQLGEGRERYHKAPLLFL